ncbi:type II toxin-antitoxin system RelE/ParE family toxin [uncultured Tenacibaculum sp.]|uniref:type II toxin-antitoxin system RelE/ParE family toxin n=1 Tax=uncultured Tenacibaculum sp. TaxID=174713 RepID=UPI002636104B|nr:type II toxin-antitoxin system RelE/ParE family toxin [uncultured Tenacibaculum sp.]
MSKLNYQLRKEAQFDLEDIFDYSEDNFGVDIAIKYLNELENTFFNLCKHPHLGKDRSEIKFGVYSFVHREHLILYKITETKIDILRVLHQSRDLPRFIKHL